MSLKNLYIIRHAESVHNVMGNDNEIDIPTYHYSLTPKGQAQALRAGELLRESVKDTSVLFIVSDYNRTRDTFMGILNSFRNHPHVDFRLDPLLRERMRPRCNNPKSLGEDVSLFYRDDTSSGLGESGAELYDRMGAFLGNLKMDIILGALPENVVLVTHSRTILALCMHLIGVGREAYDNSPQAFPNADIMRFEHNGQGGFSSDHPFLAHFKESKRSYRSLFGVHEGISSLG